ncbi:MAG: hypothetical protein RI996_12 [Candidatus Parcubacteria bacterium]|jgi:cytoskeletal protein RodZ
MRLFSVINIIVATGLIGAFLFVGLPEIAKIHPGSPNTHANTKVNVEQNVPEVASEEQILLDKCNSYAASQAFANTTELNNFIASCIAGNETAKINVIQAPSNTTDVATSSISSPRLSAQELQVKCNEFMSRAKFESENAAAAFLTNCLAGK